MYIYILYLYVHTHTVYPSSNSGKHPRNMFVDRNTNMQPYIQKNHIYNFDYDHLYTWFLKTAENDRVITVFCAMSLDSQPLQVQCALCPTTTILPSLGFTMWNAAAESPMNLQSPSTNMKCQSPCGFVPQDPRVSHQFLSYDGHALGVNSPFLGSTMRNFRGASLPVHPPLSAMAAPEKTGTWWTSQISCLKPDSKASRAVAAKPLLVDD